MTLIRSCLMIPAGAASFFLGLTLGGMVLSRLPLPPPVTPAQPQPWESLLGIILFSLAPVLLARRLEGGILSRWGKLGLFLFITFALMNVVETKLLTTLGGEAYTLLLLLPACLLGSLPAAWGISPASHGMNISSPSPVDWAGAWLAFPMVYFAFGIPAGYLVESYYRELPYLRMPTLAGVLAFQALRGAIILIAVWPLRAAWNGTQRDWVILFGTALLLSGGLAGLVQAVFFPPYVRWVHTLELTLDAFAYSSLLGFFLFRKSNFTLKFIRLPRG